MMNIDENYLYRVISFKSQPPIFRSLKNIFVDMFQPKTGFPYYNELNSVTSLSNIDVYFWNSKHFFLIGNIFWHWNWVLFWTNCNRWFIKENQFNPHFKLFLKVPVTQKVHNKKLLCNRNFIRSKHKTSLNVSSPKNKGTDYDFDQIRIRLNLLN